MTTKLYRAGGAKTVVANPSISHKSRIQHIPITKWRWFLIWKLLTKMEYDTLLVELDHIGSLSFSPSDENTEYTVCVTSNIEIIANHISGFYDMTVTLEEV